MALPAAASSSPAAPTLRSRLAILSRCSHIAAPMVGQSDVAWRMLLRQNGCPLVYTQMLESERFVREESYRREMMISCDEDRPLVVQFAANDADTLVAAAKLVEAHCDGVDLNLGCPQRAARTGLYGAFLLEQEQHERVFAMVRAVKASGLRVPLCVKIRLLPTVGASIAFCLGLVAAGADVITIHGRTRGFVEERRKGPADLQQIRQIVQAIRRHESEAVARRAHPVIIWTNGNVRCDGDVEDNITFTQANGCMVGEALLNDPTLFSRCGASGVAASAVLPHLATYSPTKSLLSLAEWDRKVAIAESYIRLLQHPPHAFASPFSDDGGSSASAAAGAPSSASPVVSDSSFSTPVVSWSNFHSHLYHLFNSDTRSRFLHHTQLIDDFLDATSIAELHAVMKKVRERIEQRRPFDAELQLKLDTDRSNRQRNRDARDRKRIAAEVVAAGGVKQLNSKERKRARWHQRKQDEKRRKLEEGDAGERKEEEPEEKSMHVTPAAAAGVLVL